MDSFNASFRFVGSHSVFYSKSLLAFNRLILICVFSIPCAWASSSPEILIDTSKQTLTILTAGEVQKVFNNIAVGRGGTSIDRREGDGSTPLGEFRIAWMNEKSKYHLFFGLDFPNHEHAERALRKKIIDIETYYEIRKALLRGEVPPQDTVLGGYIGIHGVGYGNEEVHDGFNWTQGCVALTNNQVDELSRWIDIGTKVFIR